MAELIEIKEVEERVILTAVSVADGDDTESSLDELEELVKTAGGQTVGRLIQNREKIHPGTYLGKGKIDELKELIWETDATGIVCDDELSPAQLRNLEDALETKVMDRTMVILDIFARHATTREGKLQVELAQLRYRAVRLVGLRNSLSRLGGGIGTRGPGESKLEIDRRRIHDRISQLKSELEQVQRHRELSRQQREKSHTLRAAIVGYTNAGKSTLLNALTQAGVLAEDKLFATLDPTARALRLPDGRQVLLIDTVGFVRRLPHHLVEAFRSTLEEAVEADVILNVCDASSPEAEEHLQVTRELLQELGCGDVPILTVFNKCDLSPEPVRAEGPSVCISAKTGQGLPRLLEEVAAALPPDRKKVTLLLPFRQGALAEQCRREGAVEREEYVAEGLSMTVTLGVRMLDAVKDYIV